MSDQPRTLRQTRRSLPIALLRARETVMGPIREILADTGVNEQKWRVLRVLNEQGPLELSHAATAACLMQSSLTRMIRPMVEDKLIIRHNPPEDRRKTVIAIAPEGQKLLLAHSVQSDAVISQIEAEFGSQNLEHLLNLLEELQKIDVRASKTG